MVMRWLDSGRALRLVAGGVALVLVGGLFFGGAQPQAVNLVPAPWDKLAHLALFALLALSCGLAMPVSRRRATGLGLVIAVVLGLLDEYHQLGLPGRHADMGDLLADGAGALIGAWAVWLLRGWGGTGTHG